MKKLLGILLIVCLLTGIAAAGAFAEGASGDVEIWYYWETEGHQKALSHIIEEFNASQSAIKVSAKYVPFADFKKQLSIGAAADALPDLVILDNPDHAAYAAMGVFADITGKFDVSTYYPGPVNSCTPSTENCTACPSEATTWSCSTTKTCWLPPAAKCPRPGMSCWKQRKPAPAIRFPVLPIPPCRTRKAPSTS